MRISTLDAVLMHEARERAREIAAAMRQEPQPSRQQSPAGPLTGNQSALVGGQPASTGPNTEGLRLIEEGLANLDYFRAMLLERPGEISRQVLDFLSMQAMAHRLADTCNEVDFPEGRSNG